MLADKQRWTWMTFVILALITNCSEPLFSSNSTIEDGIDISSYFVLSFRDNSLYLWAKICLGRAISGTCVCLMTVLGTCSETAQCKDTVQRTWDLHQLYKTPMGEEDYVWWSNDRCDVCARRGRNSNATADYPAVSQLETHPDVTTTRSTSQAGCG